MEHGVCGGPRVPGGDVGTCLGTSSRLCFATGSYNVDPKSCSIYKQVSAAGPGDTGRCPGVVGAAGGGGTPRLCP